ncbi:mucin-21-like isoform X2 [Rana temporaria]|uniref:mucin-21-like isoform X2 n=1 Tax=Rana temporaria TaxID=8407 RepID=UPI001AADCB97|nr:mucin-21-like isoform X2 [Rana temporaria]
MKMVDLKTLVALFLVTCLHLQFSNAAPLDVNTSPLPPFNINANKIDVHLSIPTTKQPSSSVAAVLLSIHTTKQPSLVTAGVTSNATVSSGITTNNVSGSTVPGSVPTVKNTVTPALVNVTSQPPNSSSGAASSVTAPNNSSGSSTVPGASFNNSSNSNTTSGSGNGNNVTANGGIPSATPSNAVNGTNSNFSVTLGNMSSNAIALSLPPFASVPPRIGVLNPAEVNLCPEDCPNGVGGNPPCVCSVPILKVPSF